MAHAACRPLACVLPGLPVAQGDIVGLGDVVGLDGSEPQAQALASLPQQLEGVGGGALRGGALRISPVFLDEVGLQGCGDFVGRLQRVVDSPVPCSVVNHGASIAPLRASGVLGTLQTYLLVVDDVLPPWRRDRLSQPGRLTVMRRTPATGHPRGLCLPPEHGDLVTEDQDLGPAGLRPARKSLA